MIAILSFIIPLLLFKNRRGRKRALKGRENAQHPIAEGNPVMQNQDTQIHAQAIDPSSSKRTKIDKTQPSKLSDAEKIRINLNYEYLCKEPPFKVGHWAGRKRVLRMTRAEH